MRVVDTVIVITTANVLVKCCRCHLGITIFVVVVVVVVDVVVVIVVNTVADVDICFYLCSYMTTA